MGHRGAVDRRSFLTAGLTAGALAVGAGVLGADWRNLALGAGESAAGPYGSPSATPDANGLHLPADFSSRVVAVSGEPIASTRSTVEPYVWHTFPDGGATFPAARGGWVYVSNAEVGAPDGGVGVIRFAADGTIVRGYRILDGTGVNCAGGPTPWGTWLSCEERDGGHVWECDPQRPGQGIERPAMGTFSHEAAAVDARTKAVYLTEDDESSRLYRFVPDDPPDLAAGRLQAAIVDAGGAVTWKDVPATAPDRSPETAVFRRGEGAWSSKGGVLFTTTSDNRVWELNTAKQRLRVLYDGDALDDPPLTGVDNVTIHARSGDAFVAEDGGNLELCVVARATSSRPREVAPFLRLAGPTGSEIAGPAFSPVGDRLYFSSQRGTVGSAPGPGITFEVTGPFRRRR